MSTQPTIVMPSQAPAAEIDVVELDAPRPPAVPVGPTSIIGVLLALVAALAAIAGGIDGNDTATISGAATAAMTVLVTLGGRFAQAVVLARQVAQSLEPIIDALSEEDDDAALPVDLPTPGADEPRF